MKRSYLIIGMAGALVAPNLHATISTGTVDLSNSLYGAPNGGGPFLASITSSPLPPGVNTPFYTICLSIDTTFNPGNTYNFVVSPTVVHDSNPGYPIGYSYITVATATIYNDFLNGAFNSALGLVNDGSVQAAIWYYQGHLNGTTDPEYSTPLGGGIAAVQLFLGLSSLVNPTGPNTALPVDALDLYAGPNETGVAQPQLVDPLVQGLTPVPEASTLLAGALMLLPFGVSTIRIMRKKMIA